MKHISIIVLGLVTLILLLGVGGVSAAEPAPQAGITGQGPLNHPLSKGDCPGCIPNWPVPVSPAAYSCVISPNYPAVTFTWLGSARADGYDVGVYKFPALPGWDWEHTMTMGWWGYLTTTTLQVTLPLYGKYFWWVNAYNVNGGTGWQGIPFIVAKNSAGCNAY